MLEEGSDADVEPSLLLVGALVRGAGHSGVFTQRGESTLVDCLLEDNDDGVFVSGGRSRLVRCTVRGGDTSAVHAAGGSVEVVGGTIGGEQVALFAPGGQVSARGATLVGGTEGVYEATEDGRIAITGCDLVPLDGKLGELAGVTVEPGPSAPERAPKMERRARGFVLDLPIPRPLPGPIAARARAAVDRWAQEGDGRETPRDALEGDFWREVLEGFGRLMLGADDARCAWAVGEQVRVFVPDEDTGRRVDAAYHAWLDDPAMLVWAVDLAESPLAIGIGWARLVAVLAASDLKDLPRGGVYRVRTAQVRRAPDGALEMLLPADADSESFARACEELADVVGAPIERDDDALVARFHVGVAAVALTVDDESEAIIARISDVQRDENH